MSVSDDNAIAAILDAQYEDYQAMKSIGLKQRNCLAHSDLTGLDDSFRQMHACMERIRLRESRLPPRWQALDDPAIATQRAALLQIIGELDQVRLANEQSVRDLLQETKSELRRCQSGKRAVKSYLVPATTPQSARFYDGRR